MVLGGALRQGGGVVRIDYTERNQVIIEGNIGERREEQEKKGEGEKTRERRAEYRREERRK